MDFNFPDNLSIELSKLIRSEKQVIYILAEIRKRLEKDPTLNTRYPSLWLYCCWVLHPALDKKHAIGFIELLDSQDEIQTKKIALESFREELREFLVNNNLSVEITDDEWFQFRKYFLKIITDIPLINKRATGSEIKEFCLVFSPDGIMGNSHYTYKITYADGNVEERGIMLGDYDKVTKRKEERETRRFWRRLNMKILGRRIEASKKLEGEEKKKFDEETEKAFNQMNAEEAKDAEEEKQDVYLDILAGGSGWL